MQLTFIIGTGRCGSTLLNEIISKHKDTCFFTSFEDNHQRFGSIFGKKGNDIYRKSDSFPFNWVARKFTPTEAYRLISREVSPIYVRPCRDLESSDVTPWLKKKFYDFFASNYEKHGRHVFLHKYTGWSRIGFFSEIFPEAKFIHIIRDGRAVANSWLQMKWWGGYEGPENWLWGGLSQDHHRQWKERNYSFVTLAGLSWEILMSSYDNSAKYLGDGRYLELKYEDFLTDPTEHLKKIISFSGLEWTEDFEKQFNKFNIRKSRARAFEKDLSPNQLKDLEQCISEKLLEHGYR